MNREEFINEVLKLGIQVTDEKMNMLEIYYDLLIEWNEKINLTAITDKKEVYLKHFYDSLAISKVIDLNTISSFCDIGTGAGFPGLVIKIFYPSIKLTLVDSLNKRIKFLVFIVEELGLSDVSLVHARAEEYSKENRDMFDVVSARAVAPLNVLLEYSMPLVKMNKYFIAMKGNENLNDSKNALSVMGGKVVKCEEFYLPFEDSKRTIIKIQKIKKTSSKYPRRYAEIKKKPL